jgi:hypothetical protein
MNENRLVINQVVGSNIVEYELDLFDNVPLPINKSIIDIQNIAERKSDFTKTITLPGTSNNNDIFSNIFNLARSVQNTNTYNFAPDFNPTLKANAILYKNGIAMIQGYLQLTNVSIVDDYQIEYEVIIIGRTANLFQDLGEKKLNELNLSAYNHTWNFTNIQASWTPSATRGYYYGLIDKGFSNDQKGFFTSDQKPQIFAKTIVDAIFKDAGYRYASTFFISGNFTKLVVPTTQDKLLLTETEVTNRTFEANRTSNSTPTAVTQNIDFLPFNNIILQSTPVGFDPSIYKFIVPNDGHYSFVTNSIIDFVVTTGTRDDLSTDLKFRINGNTFFTKNLLQNQGVSITSYVNVQTQNIYCLAGDQIDIVLNSFVSGNWTYSLLNNSNFFCIPNPNITVGETMRLDKCLPNDIKQADFLASIIKMFNLYVSVDALDSKKLIVETRDVYLTNDLVDLTNKIDVSKGVQIKPLGALKYKDYTFAMQEDKDELNDIYQKQYTYPYGTLRKTIENDFITESYKTEVVFAPTPLWQFTTNSKIITSRICFKDSNDNSIDSTSKLRILVAGGLSTSMGTNYFNYQDPDGTNHYFNSYPYVGHYDNIATPTLDINFTNPIQLYYKTGYSTTQTNANIYNLYHKKGIEEITNKDSKLVEYNIKLSEVEINNLSFRSLYFIDKQYYRLYEIDFDANSQEPAKLTFLKLAVAPVFVPYNLVTNGGSGGEGSTYAQNAIRNGSQYPKGVDILSQGSNNISQGYEQLINSTDNFVNGNQINVLGGSNNILSNNGSTYINTNDYQSIRDGETVINNIDQPLLASRILTISELQNLHTTPIQILSIQNGYWTEIYDAYITVFFGITASPRGYTSKKLHLQITGGDGTQLLNFDNGITTSNVAKKQRGVNIYDLPFKEGAIEIHTAGNLGTSGNSQILIELEYRLHPIIQ